MEKKQYTIGQMAHICNVTANQLRHYDKKGILSPQGRQDNNYRLYTEKQIDDILLIKELKKIGLPLKSIASLIRDKELGLIKSQLGTRMCQIRQEMAFLQRQSNQLVDVMFRIMEAMVVIEGTRFAGQAENPEDIRLVGIPKQKVVFTRYRDDLGATVNFVHRYAELLSVMEQNQLFATGPIYALFHQHYSKQFSQEESERMGDLEIFIPVDGDCPSLPQIHSFGGFQAAMATYVGDYPGTKKAYDRLDEWATEHGYAPSGISFQEFVVGRTITDRPECYMTKIYYPLDLDSL